MSYTRVFTLYPTELTRLLLNIIRYVSYETNLARLSAYPGG